MKIRNPKPFFFLLIMISAMAMIYLNAQVEAAEMVQTAIPEAAVDHSEAILPDVGLVKSLIQKIGELF